jgi:hypothetical protein
VKTPRPHSCNVLRLRADGRDLWQFDTGNGAVSLHADEHLAPGAPLPRRRVAKDWRTLWQKKINIAWLPPDQVFLRVIRLPPCEPSEFLAMIELQLEKVSPLPTNQIVWGAEALPGIVNGLQTAIVMIAERGLVEEFLGKLEGNGYLADRLELPFLHQLLSTEYDGDGVWIFLQPAETRMICLAAWWWDGTLQELNLFPSPKGESGAADLCAHLTNIAWAGEMEGWLTSPPRWRLVADPETTAEWEPVLRRWSGQPIDTSPLPSAAELAALSAGRASGAEARANLLPPEFAARYRQQFFDRLWMRGLGAATLLYILGVLIYFGAVEVLRYQQRRVENQVASLSGAYNQALQLKGRLRVLQEQVNLRYAALDCWKVVSDLLPSELTLSSLTFSRGNRLSLRGTALATDQAKITEYNTEMGKATLNGTRVFKKVNPASIDFRGNEASWSFDCDLQQTEIE